MFNIKPKKEEKEVLQHSLMVAPGFSYSPQAFYDSVECALAERKIPGLEVSRVEYAEGGLLSNQRTYLRIMRERLAFEACAAPFGSDYFFSCRTLFRPAEIRFWHVLGLVAFLYLVFYPLAQLLGVVFAGIAVATLVVAVMQVFRNTNESGFSDLDQLLLKIPALGPIYERWFRKDTYHRQDTRLVYLEIVPKLIVEIVEEITAANGAKLVRSYERAPILGDLYKPKSSPSLGEYVLGSRTTD